MPLNDPIGSSALDVLQRNASDMDKFISQPTGTVTTRLNETLTPLPVRNDQIQQVIDDAESDLAAAVASTGWFVVGAFADGFTFTARNQVGRDSTGELWSYNGSALPFSVSAGTVPSSPTYTNRGDAALRSALALGTADVGGVPASTLAIASVTVASIKDLGSIASPRAGVHYNTTGYYAGAVVSSKTFIYDSSLPRSNHNGGTIIAPPAIAAWDGTQANIATILNWTGTGNGCWRMVHVAGTSLLEISDLDFGAVCDGETDDYLSGQAALDSGAGLVYFHGGFNTSQQLNIPTTVKVIESNRILIKNTISTDNKSVFYGEGLNQITIKNLGIQPPAINSTSSLHGAAICLWDCSNITIDQIDVVARGNSTPEGDGITLVRPAGASVTNIKMYGADYDADNAANTQDAIPQGVSIWQGGSNIVVSDAIVFPGWGYAFRVQVDKDGDSPENVDCVKVSNFIADGIHSHAFLVYNDDINTVGGLSIKNVDFSNCTLKNGTGKTYNSATGLRIYGIGFYNQGGKNVTCSQCHVLNSLQNTTTDSGNPIPSAAFASTNGSFRLFDCSAIGTFAAPAIFFNCQRDQINIFDGDIVISGFKAEDNDNSGNDASVRFTQAKKLVIDKLDIEKTNTTSSCIKIDSAGFDSTADYTDEVSLSNITTDGGRHSMDVTDCNNLTVSGKFLAKNADRNAVVLSNVGSHNISGLKTIDHSRSVVGSALTSIVGLGNAAANGSRILNSCEFVLTSGSGTGCALAVPTVANNNKFSGITNQYSGEYGEERASTDTATPDVFGCSVLTSTTATPTAITNFLNGSDLQVVTVIQTSGTRNIVNGATIKTKSGANITLTATTTASFRLFSGLWYEI